MAQTYASPFVGAAYGKDLLMTVVDNNEDWIYKNKEGGMLAAVQSLGIILLWEIEEGITQIDKYIEAGDDNIVAGGVDQIQLMGRCSR